MYSVIIVEVEMDIARKVRGTFTKYLHIWDMVSIIFLRLKSK